MIICEVIHDGDIKCNKKIYLLDKNIISEMKIPIISAKDVNDISSSIFLGIDIFSSVVKDSSDLDDIRELVGNNREIKILARIETNESIINFDSIIHKCDGIIISHGLIKSEMSYEDVIHINIVMYSRKLYDRKM